MAFTIDYPLRDASQAIDNLKNSQRIRLSSFQQNDHEVTTIVKFYPKSEPWTSNFRCKVVATFMHSGVFNCRASFNPSIPSLILLAIFTLVSISAIFICTTSGSLVGITYIIGLEIAAYHIVKFAFYSSAHDAHHALRNAFMNVDLDE